ncbi:uncharacterized protein Dvar_25920 [Desulfosarcina variabilis str. Montpellier]|uniref:hypothetical protein n=1 Tax=Desulfosarcina variabilis TaxID=2300 RepID=UPI003AFA5841
MFGPRPIDPGDRLGLSQRIVVGVMNVLLLVELTVCMYIGQQDPETLTLFFLKTFPPLAVTTVIISRFLVRRLAGSDAGGRSQ